MKFQLINIFYPLINNSFLSYSLGSLSWKYGIPSAIHFFCDKTTYNWAELHEIQTLALTVQGTSPSNNQTAAPSYPTSFAPTQQS